MRLDVVITSLTPVFKLPNFFQVLQSVQALVHPVQMQRLTIQPINLLVSIHASLKLYIASDHTPLSFSLFERGPLCTTARQLVHALAMHYAAGALFRAGRWRMKELQIKTVCISYIHTELAMFHMLNSSVQFIGTRIYNPICWYLFAFSQEFGLKKENPQLILTCV